jgi:hypothetical protein
MKKNSIFDFKPTNMEKTVLNKKIKTYSALAGSFALLSSGAEAQIIYTDVNPDSTTVIPGNFYNLDLNNDGTFDFTINLNAGTGTATSQQVAITPVTSNGVAGDTVGMYVYPFALNAGDTVKASLQFNLGANQSMGSYFGPTAFYGHWLGATDKYLGLSFYIGANLHYGWARLDVDSMAGQFTIKDYAYNGTPNAIILAGETGVGIHEITSLQNIIVYGYDKNIKIIFTNELPIDNAEIKISNILGQEIYHSAISNKNTDINLADKKSGIYFVTITNKNAVFTKKINLR